MADLSTYTVTIITKEDSPYNVIPSAPIEIRERLSDGSSGGLSVIFSDQAGLTPITQTGATCNDLGQFTFFAAASQYNAIYDNNGITVTLSVDVGVTADVLPDAINTQLINDLTQTINFDDVAAYKAFTKLLPVKKRVYLADRDAYFTVISGTGAATERGIIASSTQSQSASIVRPNTNPKAWGAVEDGVTDDTDVLLEMLSGATGDGVLLNEKTYEASMPVSIDPGNDKLFMLNASSNKSFIGKGQNSVLNLNLVNSFNGSFDVVGLDQREPVGGKFTVGNFTIKGDKANKKASQSNTLVRLKTGTVVTATNYTVDLLDVWVQDSTAGGVFLGCDVVNFNNITVNDCDDTSFGIDNTSGDGRRIYINGGDVVANNSGVFAVDYSGFAQANNGPCTSNIRSITGDGNNLGIKLAGFHGLTVDKIELTNTNLTSQDANSAFWTNTDFDYATIGTYRCEDSYNGALAHSKEGTIKIGRLISRNNNTASNGNGDITQGGVTSTLIISDYDGIGHANSSVSVNILDGNHTDIGISRLLGFNKAVNYPISIKTNGYCKLSGGDIEQDNATGVFIMRLDTDTTGQIFCDGFGFSGSQLGHGPRAQGAGDVFFSNMNVDGFTGNNIDDTGFIGQYSNIKGFAKAANTTILTDVTDRINNQDKYEGKSWFNGTTNLIMYATGDAAASTWVDGAGGSTITPV